MGWGWGGYFVIYQGGKCLHLSDLPCLCILIFGDIFWPPNGNVCLGVSRVPSWESSVSSSPHLSPLRGGVTSSPRSEVLPQGQGGRRVPSGQSTGLTQSICPTTTAGGLGGKADPAAAPLPRAGGQGVGRGQSREVHDRSRGTRARGLPPYRPPAEKPPSLPFVSNGQARLRSVGVRP